VRLWVLCLLITCCASADAATMHRFGSPWGPLRQHRLVAPRAGARFAVPCWTAGQTRHWLDNASTDPDSD
jgi:hypothetical protein